MNDERRDEDRIDLPLGGEDEALREPDREPGGGPAWDPRPEEQAGLAGEPPAAAPPVHPGAGDGEPVLSSTPDSVPERRANRLPVLVLGALAILVVLALAGLAGYLLPRPAPPVLRVEPSLLDFGARSAGDPRDSREIVVTSTGERPARIEAVELADPGVGFDLAAGACSGTELAPGRTCGIPVAFEPEGSGPRRTTLEIRGDFANAPLSVVLLGEGLAPHLAIDRRSLDFGERPVGPARSPGPGVERAERALTVSNDGTGPLNLAGAAVEGPAAADFTVSVAGCLRGSLEPGQSCPVSVAFAPTEAGERRATLRLRPGPGAESLQVPPVELVGTGLPAGRAGALAVEGIGEDGLSFGAVATAGGGAAEALRLVNRGDGPLTVRRLEVTEGAEAFSVAGSECAPGTRLAPGAACRVTVRFAPAGEAEAAGALTVTAAQGGTSAAPGAPPGEPVTVAVPLRGRGTVARLVPAPAELGFGESRVGREGPLLEAAFASTGSGAVEIARVELVGTDSGAFSVRADTCSGRTLEPGERCTVEALFRPRQEGVQSARLQVVSPSLPEPPAIRLRGAGSAARVRLDPPTVRFERVAATRSATRKLTVTSAGRAPVEIRSVEVRSTPEGGGGAFGVVTEDCTDSLALAPGETCDVTVRFAPRSAGEAAAEVAVVHDGPGSPAVARLDGVAEPAPAPRFAVSPGTVRFGEQAVGERSAIETVTIRNRGTERMVIREVGLAGPGAGSFRIVPGTCEGAGFISPGSECTVGVRFVPEGAGGARAELVFRHDAGGGVDRVALEGVGVGGG